MSVSEILSDKNQGTRRLQKIFIEDCTLSNGKKRSFNLTYQVFGKAIGSAPVVLINHALTGNSEVGGKNGWWKNLVGNNQIVDTQRFTVIAFDIPGNGYDKVEEHLINDYKSLTTQIIAELFWKGLDLLQIQELFAVLGSSLGGGIAWEMAFLEPQRIKHLIPIATNLKASDWLIGNVLVQERILNHSSHPIEDARMHAMHLYRNPASFQAKFKGDYLSEESQYTVESWLNYHGRALEKRFHLSAYKLMNYLLKTIGQWVTEKDIEEFSKKTTSQIHFIVVDSDVLFTRAEQVQSYEAIHQNCERSSYQEVNSIHGHDAFLIEYEQLNALLQPIFQEL